MTLDIAVMRFAAVVVLISAILSVVAHPYWIGLTIFAGLNMLQASFTGFCPAAMLFKRMGIASGQLFK